MKLIKLSYKGFEFPINPRSIQIDFAKKISTRTLPFAKGRAQEICFEPCVISGSGSLTGSNARRQAHELMRIFKSEGSAYLFSPEGTPLKAFFQALRVSYNAEKECVDYTFTFVEDGADKSCSYPFGFTYAQAGENLYDIANRTDTDAATLFNSNCFADMFAVEEGDKVWLN